MATLGDEAPPTITKAQRYYAKNAEARRLKSRIYYQENREAVRSRQRANYTPEARHAAYLRSKARRAEQKRAADTVLETSSTASNEEA